jgi:hypothetical protein
MPTFTQTMPNNPSDSNYSCEQWNTVNNDFWAGGPATVGLYNTYYMNAGFRFTNVTIPQGANIISATIRIRPYANSTSGNINIRMANYDSTGAWAKATGPVLGAKTSSGYDTWNPGSVNTSTNYTSPDFKAGVQEVVNRAGWVSGYDMGVYLLQGWSSGYFRVNDNASSNNPYIEIQWVEGDRNASTSDSQSITENVALNMTFGGGGLNPTNVNRKSPAILL